KKQGAARHVPALQKRVHLLRGLVAKRSEQRHRANCFYCESGVEWRGHGVFLDYSSTQRLYCFSGHWFMLLAFAVNDSMSQCVNGFNFPVFHPNDPVGETSGELTIMGH